MTKSEAQSFVDAVVAIRESATDEQALAAPAIYPVWDSTVTYTAGNRVLYNGVLYKCLQDHAAQENWTPTAAPSLWAKVLIPDPEVIPEWEQPDSTNPYMTGDKVTHNGSTWISLVDNNVWEPGAAGTESIWKQITE